VSTRTTGSIDSETPHPRDGSASQRDRAAEKRDGVASRRDRTADIADRRALELDDGDTFSARRTRQAPELVARGLEGRERAARDRKRAKHDRERAKRDRRLAGADRESGESDREESKAWGHLAALVDSSEDAIIARSLDGQIESWNRAAEQLFGYTSAEMVGESDAMLVPPERQEEHERILGQIERTERVEPLETVRLTKDGRRIDVGLRISLVYNADGQLVGTSSISRDIAGQKLLEAQLRRSSRYFDLARDLTVACGFDGIFKSVNPAVEQILGWTAEEFMARTLLDLVHPDDLAATLQRIANRAGGEHPVSVVNRFRAKDGTYRWLDWTTMVSPDEELTYASARDITDRVHMEGALREAEERFHTAFDRAPIGICLISLEAGAPARLVQVNPAMSQLVGRSVVELAGVPLASLTHPDDRAEIDARLAELTDGGHTANVEFETRLTHRDGHSVWMLISGAVLSGGSGEHTTAITHIIDISDRKHSERQLQHLADHDTLTGLFNRRRFTEELGRALRQAKRHREAGAVLFLDLDGFKFVNDTLGHAAGDRLISRVAAMLTGAVRETDTLARIGGDEFAILLTRCDPTAAVGVAEKLLATLRPDEAAGDDDRRVRVSSSIGIALFAPDDGLRPDELVVQADIAMYDAKNAGKDRCALYDPHVSPRNLMATRETSNERLRRAIRDHAFVLHAQPIAAIAEAGTPAFELLLRLPDGDGNLTGPAAFLADAEESGLIGQIDRWVLGQAVRRLRDSHAASEDLMLSINVSATTIGDPAFAADVAELLARCPVPAGRLMFEITETVAIKNIDAAQALAERLRALGCKLAIDDFGAGFASFYYLKMLHFDYLKIDGEYIRELCRTPTDQLVVEAIVTLARGLGTTTIAEFVGDRATVEELRRLGVDHGQGYHLGRPGPLDERLPYLTRLPQSSP